VLSAFDRIKVCVGYEHEGKIYETFPPHQTIFHKAVPIYKEFEGWRTDISGARSWADLPKAAQTYVESLEQMVGVPITQISVGAEATETVTRLAPVTPRSAQA
jgi:adenylosuccinate synthase